jgi:hypothetical protein
MAKRSDSVTELGRTVEISTTPAAARTRVTRNDASDVGGFRRTHGATTGRNPNEIITHS